MNRVIGPDGRTLAHVEILHPGPGLGFVGPHRRVPGGVLTAEGDLLLLPDLRSAAWTPDGLLLGWRSGSRRIQLGRWGGRQLDLLRQLRGSGVRLGGRWLSCWLGAAARVETVIEGDPVQVPVGLRRAHCAPDAPELLHAQGRALIRVDARGQARVVGVVDGRIRGLFPGPAGSAVGWSDRGAFVLTATGGPRALALQGPLLAASFSDDGAEALVEDDEGVFRIELDNASLVGFQPDVRTAGWPQVADLCGGLRDWDDDDDGPMALPGPGLHIDGRLHGPAGLAWDLATAQPVAVALTAGADLACVLGGALVVVDDHELLLRDANGEDQQIAVLDDDDTALELAVGHGVGGPFAVLRSARGVRWGDQRPKSWRHLDLLLPSTGSFLAPLQDGSVHVPSAEGDRLLVGAVQPHPLTAAPPASPPRPPAATPPAFLRGLPVDGCIQTPDGHRWVWQDDGVLLRASPH